VAGSSCIRIGDDWQARFPAIVTSTFHGRRVVFRVLPNGTLTSSVGGSRSRHSPAPPQTLQRVANAGVRGKRQSSAVFPAYGWRRQRSHFPRRGLDGAPINQRFPEAKYRHSHWPRPVRMPRNP
jgi:hypothetical protein